MLPLLAGVTSKLLLPSAKNKKSGAEVASAITKRQSKQNDNQNNSTAKSSPIIKTISVAKLLDLKTPDSSENAIIKSEKPGSDFEPIDNVLDKIDDVLFSIKNTIITTNKFKKDKLSKENQEKKKIQKREREAQLERKPRTFGLEKLRPKVPDIPFLDRITQFFSAILIGSLVSFLIKKYEEIVFFITDIFEKIKSFFKVLEPIFNPIWNGLKWIVGEGAILIAKIVGVPPIDADKNTILQNLSEITKSIPIIGNLFKGIENIVKSLGFGGTPNDPSGQPGGPPTASGDLFEIIAGGEGGYNSVNRGNAGDTPGGAQSIFGKPLTEMTVGEVRRAQKSRRVFAVGKYQIIPDTMEGFVRVMKISDADKFDAATQEKFKEYVINYKRPAVGRYIRGESSNRALAAQELAREFASVGLAFPEAGRVRGESRYSGTAGNRASISPERVEAALDIARSGKGVSTSSTTPPTQSPSVSSQKTSTQSPSVSLQKTSTSTSTQSPSVSLQKTSTQSPSVSLQKTSTQSSSVSLQKTSTQSSSVSLQKTSTQSPSVSSQQTSTSTQSSSVSSQQTSTQQPIPLSSVQQIYSKSKNESMITSIYDQAEYEVSGGSQKNLIIPIPVNTQTSPTMMGGTSSLIPIGLSKTEVLNSYYRAQLMGFLYKQG